MSYVIIEYCQGALSGGGGDRVVGLCSAILLAKAMHRQVLIKWDAPSIQGVFDISKHDFYRVRPNLCNAVHLDTIDNRFKFQEQLSHQPIHQQFAGRNIVLRCNQEIAYFLYQNPHLGLQTSMYHNDMLTVYRSIFVDYLVPLSITTYVDSPYLAVQIRAGDAYMGVGSHQPVKNVESLVTSLAQSIKSHLHLNQYNTIYVTSDHPFVKDYLQRHLSDKTIVHTPSSRVHLEKSGASTAQLQSLFSDLFTLVKADTLLISSYSNYGRMGALMSVNTTVYGFDEPSATGMVIVKPIDRLTLFTKHPTPPSRPQQRRIGVVRRKVPVRAFSTRRPTIRVRPGAVRKAVRRTIIKRKK